VGEVWTSTHTEGIERRDGRRNARLGCGDGAMGRWGGEGRGSGPKGVEVVAESVVEEELGDDDEEHLGEAGVPPPPRPRDAEGPQHRPHRPPRAGACLTQQGGRATLADEEGGGGVRGPPPPCFVRSWYRTLRELCGPASGHKKRCWLEVYCWLIPPCLPTPPSPYQLLVKSPPQGKMTGVPRVPRVEKRAPGVPAS